MIQGEEETGAQDSMPPFDNGNRSSILVEMPAINILYHQGSGSQGIDLVQEMPDPKYQATKRTAIRYMKANYVAPGAIELLEQFPFSLWQATNDFGDDFEVLYMKAPMELFVEIENEVGVWRQRIVDGIPEIVRAPKEKEAEFRLR
jgi:hypothetical protein